jgi:hypothetical protein
MNALRTRDERETAVDRAGDRLAYLVVSYGLLVVVAYRSFVDGQASWELLGLVLLGGAVGTAYRLRHRALTREAMLVAAITLVVAAVVATVVALGLGR